MSRIRRGLKNFSYLTVGSIISQVIGFIGYIYIVRLLGPEYYGIYVTVGAFVGMFQILTFTGLRKVLVREGSKDVQNADKVLNDTIGLQSLFIFIAIIVMLIASIFTDYETTTKLYIAIFSLNLFSTTLKGFVNTIFKMTERMEFLAIFSIIRITLYVGLAILLLTLGYGLFAIVLVSVFTTLFNFLIRLFYSRKLINFNIFSKLKFDKKIIKPSIVFSAMGIVGRLHDRVDLFMISILGNPFQVAIYGVAYQLAKKSTLLRNTLAEAFFPIAVKTFKEGSVSKRLIIKYTLLFTGGMLGLAIIGYFLAEPAIDFVFGEEYTEAGPILKILIFYMVAWFSTLPFTEAVQATGNEKVILLGKSVMAGLNIPLNIILYLNYGLIGIAYSTIIIYTIGSIIINYYSYHLLNKQGYLK